ncbi:MAG TPA: zinc ribbon domain-containing protein [Nocardioides sp.]|jgi:hypothetical protein|nr:zinc ribbon domain-containing protein [Nocardioides sp.]
MDDQSSGGSDCAHCGAPLTGGRFCTNCGARIGTVPAGAEVWPAATDTAERRYDVPAPAPAPTPSPTPDITAQRPAYAAAGSAVPPPVADPLLPRDPAPTSHARPGPGVGLWVAVGAALLVMLLLGGYLLFHGIGGQSTASRSTPPLVPRTHHTPASPHTRTSSPPTASPTPSGDGTVSNVAGLARASAPAHAPAGVDFTGRPVTYVAANLVDGVADTCWRRDGDATGTVLTFHLDQPTRLTRVGLINGYAKIAYDGGRRYDWYRGNRRVLAVDWLFDDGSSVSQRLQETRGMQQVAIKPVTTSVVRLRITAVSPPGKGRAARNDTAISEVSLIGRTA